jgi:hypothetical protein
MTENKNRTVNLVRLEKPEIEVLPAASADAFLPTSESGGVLETFLLNSRINRETSTLACKTAKTAQENALLQQHLIQRRTVNDIREEILRGFELVSRIQNFDEDERRKAEEREKECRRQEVKRVQADLREDVIEGLQFQLKVDEIEAKRKQVALHTTRAQKQLEELAAPRAKQVKDQLLEIKDKLRRTVETILTYKLEITREFNALKEKYPDLAAIIDAELHREIMRVENNGLAGVR